MTLWHIEEIEFDASRYRLVLGREYAELPTIELTDDEIEDFSRATEDYGRWMDRFEKVLEEQP